MLSESTLNELRTFITSTASSDRRADFAEAVDDLQRTIAAQSLLIRNLTTDLRNRRIGQQAMDALLPPDTLNALLAQLGEPKQTPFSLTDAQHACADLADQASRATDIAEIAAAIVKVAKVFL
jgi:hypothetical protein